MCVLQGGDLFDDIALSTKYTERDASSMINNLVQALKYLHNIRIVHRDVKPENLLVSSETSSQSKSNMNKPFQSRAMLLRIAASENNPVQLRSLRDVQMYT